MNLFVNNVLRLQFAYNMNIVERIQKRTAQVFLELKHKTSIALHEIHILSDEETNQRLNICYSCPAYAGNHKCKNCGCNLKLKAKIKLFHCPVNKW